MDDVRTTDVATEIGELRRLVAAQNSRLALLEAQLADRSLPPEQRSTRRGMLRLAGAAVLGGATASLVGAQPAAAASGAMQFGAPNDAGVDKTTLTSSNSDATLEVNNTNSVVSDEVFPDAVRGTATSDGTGVHGVMDGNGNFDGYAVWAENLGAGLALVGDGGRAQLGLIPFNGGGTPTGDHLVGEVVANDDGVYYCVVEGAPGTWRKLAGVASAGTYHAVTPTRVYDSRGPIPPPTQGFMLTTDPVGLQRSRTISVAHGRDSSLNITVPNLVPPGATAVAANVTVTGTFGGFGYLAINPGGNFVEVASTINWFGIGQTLANGVLLTLNNNRELTVLCNGAGGGGTHFLVDVAGYYL